MSLIQLEDGSYQIQKPTAIEGVTHYEDVDASMVVEMKKDGRIVKLYRDDEGNTYSTESRDEDERVLREVKTHIVKVQKDDTIRLLEERIKELEKEGVQKRFDRASLLDQKEGGGVVRLQDYGSGDYKGEKRQVIYDLYEKVRKGDKEAKIKLDQLWALMIPALKTQKEPFYLYECPRCSKAIEGGEDKCIFCGWSPEDSGYKRYGEINVR